MKRIIFVYMYLLTIFIFISFASVPTYAKEIKTVVIQETKLTDKMLATRKQKRIQYIEVQKVKVTNAKKKFGICRLGTKIDLSFVKGKLHKGDIVINYLVWNPYTNYEDDVIASWCNVKCKHSHIH